jgi:hypothetical protein
VLLSLSMLPMPAAVTLSRRSVRIGKSGFAGHGPLTGCEGYVAYSGYSSGVLVGIFRFRGMRVTVVVSSANRPSIKQELALGTFGPIVQSTNSRQGSRSGVLKLLHASPFLVGDRHRQFQRA